MKLLTFFILPFCKDNFYFTFSFLFLLLLEIRNAYSCVLFHESELYTDKLRQLKVPAESIKKNVGKFSSKKNGGMQSDANLNSFLCSFSFPFCTNCRKSLKTIEVPFFLPFQSQLFFPFFLSFAIEKLMIAIKRSTKTTRRKGWRKLCSSVFYRSRLKREWSKSNHNNEHYLLLQNSLSHFLLQWFFSFFLSSRSVLKHSLQSPSLHPEGVLLKEFLFLFFFLLFMGVQKRGNINDIWFRILIL